LPWRNQTAGIIAEDAILTFIDAVMIALDMLQQKKGYHKLTSLSQ